MPHSFLRVPVIGAIALAALASGCGSGELFDRRQPPAPASVPTETHESQVVAEYLRTLESLVRAQAADQAEILARSREAATVEGSTSARLKYGLVLAAPGHVGSDSAAARQLMGELLATPERLLPQERALVAITMAELESRAAIESENRQLRTQSEKRDRERQAALNRRLQALSDENEKLRQELNDANAKLDAIAKIERSMSGRRQGSDGKQP